MSSNEPSANGHGPVGDGEYIVNEGDCLESIAVTSGHFWETIWNHPRNAPLKEARGSPNVLLPGDGLHIPECELKLLDRPTDQMHRFVRKGVPSKLRLCIKQAGEPRRNERYRLVIDGRSFQGKTDGDGWIEVAIPPDASSGELTIGDDPLHQQVFSLELGGMDPITETIGVQKRLSNLGFDCEPTDELDEATVTALAMFQRSEDLEPTGEPDQTTLEKLKAQYGS